MYQSIRHHFLALLPINVTMLVMLLETYTLGQAATCLSVLTVFIYCFTDFLDIVLPTHILSVNQSLAYSLILCSSPLSPFLSTYYQSQSVYLLLFIIRGVTSYCIYLDQSFSATSSGSNWQSSTTYHAFIMLCTFNVLWIFYHETSLERE